MSDIINIKDFYNHETRITIIENSIAKIDRSLEEIKQDFKGIRKDIDANFRWILGLLALPLYSSIIGFILGKCCHWF